MGILARLRLAGQNTNHGSTKLASDMPPKRTKNSKSVQKVRLGITTIPGNMILYTDTVNIRVLTRGAD